MYVSCFYTVLSQWCLSQRLDWVRTFSVLVYDAHNQASYKLYTHLRPVDCSESIVWILSTNVIIRVTLTKEVLFIQLQTCNDSQSMNSISVIWQPISDQYFNHLTSDSQSVISITIIWKRISDQYFTQVTAYQWPVFQSSDLCLWQTKCYHYFSHLNSDNQKWVSIKAIWTLTTNKKSVFQSDLTANNRCNLGYWAIVTFKSKGGQLPHCSHFLYCDCHCAALFKPRVY